jgi:hypothetical protein
MRLFKNLDVDACLPKRTRRGHAAHPGANDCNLGCRHGSAAPHYENTGETFAGLRPGKHLRDC